MSERAFVLSGNEGISTLFTIKMRFLPCVVAIVVAKINNNNQVRNCAHANAGE